ncbi:MAG: CotH kinase family protein [Opitutales bacterium]|nr:CotH kinase family protein [Opitutales bacterium]
MAAATWTPGAGGDLLITEFMASNGETLFDESGAAPDWIEIHNPGTEPVDLVGWHLTDDAEDLTQWTFPSVQLNAASYLVVFASGLDIAVADAELHTNFRLSADGEYLGLIRPDGTAAYEYAPVYPPQLRDVSYGVERMPDGSYTEGRYFTTPTPGAPNSGGTQLAARPVFSVKRGFQTEPVVLELATETEGAEIRFTLDGSAPAADSGTVYQEPLEITGSVTVRAAAFRDGWIPSVVTTHTYIYLDDVLSQPERPDGFPITWTWGAGSGRTRYGDYGMDRRITEPHEDEIREALCSLPSVFVTTSLPNLFDTDTGIYANAGERGEEWERPASVEWVSADGETEFEIDCGLRIHGGWFRRPDVAWKHSFRLMFRGEYGASRLRHDVFKVPGAPHEFNRLVLRGGGNDGYTWDQARDTEQYTRDEFGRRLHLEMGHTSPHGKFVHLYLNGLYWGLYNVVERPNQHFSASHYGGEPEDWDSHKHDGELKNGTRDALDEMHRQLRQLSGIEDYKRVQGLNADGTRNPAYPVYFDKHNYIDYMILNMWAGNYDWVFNNYWFGRKQTADSTGFKYYLWDFEDTLGLMPRSPLDVEVPRDIGRRIEDTRVVKPHYRLKEFAEYRIDFADRVHRYLFEDGLLTPEQLIPRYRDLADHVEISIYAESARWGNQHFGKAPYLRPQTIDQWRDMRDWILETYLPQRTAIVVEQFRAKGLYPATDAPVFSRNGGYAGSEGIQMTAPGGGTVYYTLNGADPRERGTSAVSADAVAYAPPESLLAGMEGTVVLKARVLRDGEWSALQEAVFMEAPFEPFDLSAGPYEFDYWSAEAAAGTWPAHMVFEQAGTGDPRLSTPMDGYWRLPYNLTSRSRINGMGNRGVSFINTANAQDADGAGYVGSALLFLDTRGVDDVYVQWTNETVTPNERVYGMRLQYRRNGEGSFADVPGADGSPLEYTSDAAAGHTAVFGPARLPEDAAGQAYLELRWKYCHISGDSGPRAEVRLDNIHVSAAPPGAASELVIETAPPEWSQSGDPLPPVLVRAVDDSGITDTGFDGKVRLSLEGNGVLHGTHAAVAAGGSVLFEGLAVDGAGELVLIVSGDGLDSVQSQPFHVVRVVEEVMPRYIQGDQNINNDNLDRVPFAFRLRIEGLKPEATYRYGNRVVVPEDPPDQNGAGNAILITGRQSDWIRNLDSPRFRAGDFGERHLTFTTDANGTYAGWFVTEPSGNARFTPGNTVRMRLLLNDGDGGEEYFHYLTAPGEVKVTSFGAGLNEGSALYAESPGAAKNLVALYDEDSGSGRPLAATVVESTGSPVDGRYAVFYQDHVWDRAGRWGTLIPNGLKFGVRRIEELDLLSGEIVSVYTVPGGILPTVRTQSGVDAVGIRIPAEPFDGFTAWRTRHFTLGELDDASVSGPFADADGDGFENLLKHALGLALYEDAATALPEVRIKKVGSDEVLVVEHGRLSEHGHLELVLEGSTDMTTWAVLDEDGGAPSVEPVGDGRTETVVQSYKIPGEAAALLLRLRVRLVEP